ncbi:MAG: YgiT-type zinc finger protein [Candidatus Nitrotoga sp.]
MVRPISFLRLAIRDVPAEVCENCGEYYLSEPTAKRVYADADETARRHVEVEIQRYMA